jgi:hypothetical protein
MQVRHILASGLLSLTAVAAHADGFFDPHIRANVGVGQLTYRDYGFTEFGEQTVNYKATAFDVGAGFEANRYLAAEVGVRFVRDANETYFFEPAVSNIVDNLEASNFVHASLIGSLPLGEFFSLYARLGLLNWDIKGNVVEYDLDDGGSAVLFESEDDGTDLFYGAGVGINVDTGQVRLEYQAAKLGDVKTSFVTLGVVWRFVL